MRIGILTWYFGANYGAKAHSYALQQFLLEQGYESVMIAYTPPKSMLINLKMNLNYHERKKHPLLAIRCCSRYLKFNALNKIYHKTRKVNLVTDIDQLGLDLVILGSDAVFNILHPLFNEVYYGVGIKKTPKITYAPSCEQLSPCSKLTDNEIESLKELHALSVRDQRTRDLVYNNTGLKAEIVLDPTFLYDFSQIQEDIKEDENFILVYSFSEWNEYSYEFRKFAHKNYMKIVSIGRHCKWADVSYDTVSFQEWLGFFSKAKLILTDSYHGTIFSLKNNKSIVLLSRDDKINKITDLLKLMEIEQPFYSGGEIERYLLNKIDWEKVNNNIDKYSKLSKAFLTSAIEQILNS